nr:rod shape-determining protein RodA [Peptostreptococcus faecalis]
MKIIKYLDWKLISIVFVIFIFGLIILSSATHANVTGDLKQLYKQMMAFAIGILLTVMILLFDYNSIGKYYKEIYIFSILLLVIVLIPGIGNVQFGARSWIKIGNFNFQTSEIVKLTFVLSYAKILDKYKSSINDIKTIVKLMLYALPFGTLLYAQPDLGTAIVFICMIFFMLYTAGISKKIVRNTFLAILVISPILYFIMAPHQKVRIVNFFNPEASTNYQTLQSMIAIGSGGLTGKGLYNGSQNQENFLPVRDSDFIFAVIGEELGLLGMIFVVGMFVLLIYRLLTIASRSRNSYGTFIVAGISGMFAYQIIQNIGMTVGLMPVTGVTLPFVSYGGSSLITSMANIAIVLNVCLRRRRSNFYS